MKSKNPSKVKFKEVINLNYRGFNILNKYFPKLFLSIAIYSIFSSVTPYISIYLSAQIINELAGNKNPEILWKLVIITIIASSLSAIINAILLRWKNCKYAASWHKENKIYTDKMLNLDYSILDDQYTYDLRSQISQNENWGGMCLKEIILNFERVLKSIITILSSIALTVSLFTLNVPAEAGRLIILNSPLFAIALMLILLIVNIIAPFCSYKAQSYWSNYANEARFGNRIFSFFGNMHNERERALDIRMYKQNIIARSYMKKHNTFSPNSKIAKYALGPMGVLNIMSSSITFIFTGVVYIYVCLKAWAGAFGIGSVAQYIGALTALSTGVSSLITAFGRMWNNTFFLRTIFQFLDIPNKMYQGSLTTEKRTDRNYEVEFKNVSFKYPNTEAYALRNVYMKFKVGEHMAVVGMNGSGKTTFIKLLCRLYDPTEGEILLNGINIKKYRYDDYISLFAVVFQDFKLLSFELGQNVAAKQSYDKNKVIDSLNKSGFSDKLSKMSDGLESILYKDFDIKGIEVSGGEAQKIAIARALYKDAPFIILDEPTAALDPIAEAEIYTKFNEIAGDKTTVYISHRLSSCRICDEIMVFDNGHIVQQGSHEDLVTDEKGKYHELWYAQAQYYN
jgi:ATP-binding cassette subfamily B protein